MFHKYCVVFRENCVVFRELFVVFQEYVVAFADMGHRSILCSIINSTFYFVLISTEDDSGTVETCLLKSKMSFLKIITCLLLSRPFENTFLK